MIISDKKGNYRRKLWMRCIFNIFTIIRCPFDNNEKNDALLIFDLIKLLG